jgi:hypothetical protein
MLVNSESVCGTRRFRTLLLRFGHVHMYVFTAMAQPLYCFLYILVNRESQTAKPQTNHTLIACYRSLTLLLQWHALKLRLLLALLCTTYHYCITALLLLNTTRKLRAEHFK